MKTVFWEKGKHRILLRSFVKVISILMTGGGFNLTTYQL